MGKIIETIWGILRMFNMSQTLSSHSISDHRQVEHVQVVGAVWPNMWLIVVEPEHHIVYQIGPKLVRFNYSGTLRFSQICKLIELIWSMRWRL